MGVDYVLENYTAVFYGKRLLPEGCYLKFKVPDECAFVFFNEHLITGGVLELIDTCMNAVVKADVLAISIDVEGASSTTGSCVIRLRG